MKKVKIIDPDISIRKNFQKEKSEEIKNLTKVKELAEVDLSAARRVFDMHNAAGMDEELGTGFYRAGFEAYLMHTSASENLELAKRAKNFNDLDEVYLPRISHRRRVSLRNSTANVARRK